MFEVMRYEWRIYRLLRRIAKQRVGMIMQPGNVWVIEYAAPINEQSMPMVQTCVLRGWIEVLHPDVRHGKLKDDGSLPDHPLFNEKQDIWRLTDAGWSAIHRNHQLSLLGLALSAIGVIVALKA
ncbi:hypothetical protein [Solimonas flava]|uniref:hypothetical protein n=1 Tax=Solimonas flava TaxID=415849 RepID=UPI0012B5CE87|nr:hypothetical protein [Solimonas flava]